jgi:hypothetical protein
MQKADQNLVTPGSINAIAFLYRGQKIELVFTASDTYVHPSYPDKLMVRATTFKGVKVASAGGGNETVTPATFVANLSTEGIVVVGVAKDLTSDDSQVFICAKDGLQWLTTYGVGDKNSALAARVFDNSNSNAGTSARKSKAAEANPGNSDGDRVPTDIVPGNIVKFKIRDTTITAVASALTDRSTGGNHIRTIILTLTDVSNSRIPTRDLYYHLVINANNTTKVFLGISSTRQIPINSDHSPTHLNAGEVKGLKVTGSLRKVEKPDETILFEEGVEANSDFFSSGESDRGDATRGGDDAWFRYGTLKEKQKRPTPSFAPKKTTYDMEDEEEFSTKSRGKQKNEVDEDKADEEKGEG